MTSKLTDATRATVLFLDDMMDRHTTFARAVNDEVDIVHVFDAMSAISRLNAEAFAQVFLDHDLSEEDIMVVPDQPSHVPTGMTVVDHIMSMERPPMDIVIHSCNEPAALAMLARLEAHPAKPRVRRIAFPHLVQLLGRR